eukprot:s486_g10.t1
MAGAESPEKVAKPKPPTQWESLAAHGHQLDRLVTRYDRYEAAAAAADPNASPPRTPPSRKKGQSALRGGHGNVNEVALRMIVYEKGVPAPVPVSFFNLIREMFPRLTVPEDPDSDEVWHIVLAALGKDVCQRIANSAQDELLAVLSSPQMNEPWDVVATSQLFLLQERCEILKNFQILQDWLAEFMSVEVPKDGNCGAWSVQALVNSSPFQQPIAEESVKLRNEIASLWLRVSSDVLWQSIFYDIVNTFDRQGNQDKEDDPDDLPVILSENIVPKIERKTKQEPPTGKRPKPRPTEYVDLCSPPRRQVEQVGAARPVFSRRTHRDQVRAEPAPVGHTPRDEATKLIGEKLDQEPDQDPEEGEDEGEGGGEEETGAPATRKRRNRTCKKKTIDMSHRLESCVRAYLGSLEITFQYHKTFHARYCAVPSEVNCRAYRNLIEKLQKGELPKCTTCVSMLKNRGYDMDTLKGRLDDLSLDAGKPSPATAQLSELIAKVAEPEQVDASPSDLIPLQDADHADDADFGDGRPAEEPAAQPESNPDVAKDNPEDDDPDDIFESVRAMKVLEVLEPGSHDKRVPIHCTICQKVFEGDRRNKVSIRNYVAQHCRTDGHIAALAAFVLKQQLKEDGTDMPIADEIPHVPCEGLSVTHGHHRAAAFRSEIILWCKHTKLSSCLSKNEYMFNVAREELIVKHHTCKKIAKEDKTRPKDLRPCCDSCLKSDCTSATLRSAIRFAVKYWAAKLLHCRLFMSDEAYAELKEAFEATQVSKVDTKEVPKLLSMKIADLQKFVRLTWTKTPKDFATDLATQFMAAYVYPCININVSDASSEMRQVVNKFASDLAMGKLSELGQMSAKIAKASCDGRLAGNPAIMGLVMQAISFLDRDQRGASLKGGDRRMTEVEKAMVTEAGVLLATNSCSKDLMRLFGFSKENVLRQHSRVDSLLADSLPCPALAFLHPEVLAANMSLIDSAEPRHPEFGQKDRLVVCLDFTYLLAMHTSMVLHQRRGMVGGPFFLDDCHEEFPICFHDINKPESWRQESQKANRMFLADIQAHLG